MSAQNPSSVPKGILLRDVGAASIQGGRASQEDRFKVLLPQDFPSGLGEKHAFLAIYDGHGTDVVSEHASQHLHKLILKRPEFNEGRYEEAIRGALQDEDNLLLEGFRKGFTEYAHSGCTVTLCLLNLTAGTLISANVGDSHTILADHNVRGHEPAKIRRLTLSHKPSMPSEKIRIEDAGGQINEATNTPRIGALNMSRSLGDLEYKNPLNKSNDDTVFRMRKGTTTAPPEERGDMLTIEPHIEKVTLEPGHRYVLALTSDGMTDNTDDATIIDRILQGFADGLDATDIATRVASASADHTRSDNATLVTAFLES